MIDVLFYDDRGGFGPSFNRSHAVGGAEIHLVQVAEYLAAAGCRVVANVHQNDYGSGVTEGGVDYHDSRRWPWGESPTDIHVDTCIVVGCASFPVAVRASRVFAFQVVDPRPCGHMFEHLRGRATMVCVSDWQASLFRELGHRTVVIPVPIPDEWYERRGRRDLDFVCISSWNKGTQRTLELWDRSWGELCVGSSYSHPDDAEQRCADVGARWLGMLRGQAWADVLYRARAFARVCTIGETFGVADVAAMAQGVSTYTLCEREAAALAETGLPFHTREAWEHCIRARAPLTQDVQRYRASRVLPQWMELLGEKLRED